MRSVTLTQPASIELRALVNAALSALAKATDEDVASAIIANSYEQAYALGYVHGSEHLVRKAEVGTD